MRYGLALLVIAGYIASFFIPLLSVAPQGATEGGVSAVLRGGSPFDLHYLSIGIFPFLFAAILHSVAQWQFSPFLDWLRAKGIGDDAFRLGLAVLLACAMTYQLVAGIPEYRFRVSFLLTAAECLLSVYFVYEMLRLVGKSQIVGNPLMLFIGVNCVAAIAGSLLRIDYAGLDVIGAVWLGGGCVLGILTLLAAYGVNKIALHESVVKPIDPTGGLAAARTTLSFPVMRAGITPVVYSAFIFFPIMMSMTSHTGASGLILSPLWLVAYALLVFVITYSLLKSAIPREEITRYMRAKGIMFTKDIDHARVLIKQQCAIAVYATLWLCILMVVQGAWQLFSPDSVSRLNFVGGLAPLLLLSVGKDMVKQYRTKTW